MRTAFIETLFALARTDSRIVLVTGDLGFGVVMRFKEELPRQFVNAGVAEQNMTGLAAGMALSGKIVFTYSIANFPVIRCLEQIRNDVCYHNANVKIVAVGGGFAYGSLGMTHHATEDVAMMRALPNMKVLAPNDPVEARYATNALVATPGPCYLRLGRAGEPLVHPDKIDFDLGKAIMVRPGNDLTLVVTGGLLNHALHAAEQLSTTGIEARVLSMHTIKPLDREALLAAARETQLIVTIEEHSVIGGLGSATAELLMDENVTQGRFKRIGIVDKFSSKVGDQDYLRGEHGLDAAGIAATIQQFWRHEVEGSMAMSNTLVPGSSPFA
jgi:transketolase